MKKLVLATVAATASFAINANAATLITTTADNRATVAASSTGCPLLSEGVTLTLSQNVVASYSCNATTNIIALAGCHPNGLKVGANNAQNNYYTASTAGGVIKASQGAACVTAGGDTGSLADTASGTPVEDPTGDDDTATTP
ncbi:hypothetical protein [Stutzerimonas kunmingensis]|uniref:hypothetical protein n=1 Tax=Stutzerimonas kunmingensis TaxID=1211807 RepID=UPI002103750D|nr:hypothetical protein [Stutzerimonas kunmingensis]MCQ2034106.1 hypothetical protein [Stutzerimonas kunmingensis]